MPVDLDLLRHVLTYQQEVEWENTKLEVLQEIKVDRHRASIDAKVIQSTWVRTRRNECSSIVIPE